MPTSVAHVSAAHAAAAPAATIDSDEDYAALRADYDALEPGDPARAMMRTSLERWLVGEARRELDAHRPDSAVDDAK